MFNTTGSGLTLGREAERQPPPVPLFGDVAALLVVAGLLAAVTPRASAHAGPATPLRV